ncbi:MAG: enoyl-CoA hydratase/isomerase family protein [Candidatus Helarchaeota archaeon]
MEYKTIITKKEENIAFLTINRPDKLNALNETVKTEINSALDDFENDDDVKIIMISGSGEKAFIAGDDISEFESRSKSDFEVLQNLTTRISNLKKITIASIQGYALGGGLEIALACDFRIATINSKFGFPEINLGLIPGAGGTQRLPRLIGETKSLELILTGDLIDSKKALEIGLINSMVENDALMEESLKLAKKISEKNLQALQVAKESIRYHVETDMKSCLQKELDLLWKLVNTDESRKRVKEFLKKK